MTVAAYIDLNPVRAGIVDWPEDYRWCSFAKAVAGDETTCAGLGRILDFSNHICGDDFHDHWKETAKLYRLWLLEFCGDSVATISNLASLFSVDTIPKIEGVLGDINWLISNF